MVGARLSVMRFKLRFYRQHTEWPKHDHALRRPAAGLAAQADSHSVQLRHLQGAGTSG